MERLATFLESTQRVLFITGAGLSVHSGIPPYRGSTDAVWSNFVTSYATRKKFLSNPLDWWNKFWLATHYKTEYLNAEPNLGHDALAYLCRRCPNACVITQNVDGLHTTSGIPDAQLIEIHGSMHGGFKCINDTCTQVEQHIDHTVVDLSACAKDPTAQPGDVNFELAKVPVCPDCSDPLLPQALLFDEEYSSHPYYEWDAANDWIEDACAIVFVGTSFSVGLTHIALEASRKKKPTVALFNINLTPSQLKIYDARRMHDMVGPSEQVLPLLAHVVGQRLASSKRRKASRKASGKVSGKAHLPAEEGEEVEAEVWNTFLPGHHVFGRDGNGALVKSKAMNVVVKQVNRVVVVEDQEDQDDQDDADQEEGGGNKRKRHGSNSASSSSNTSNRHSSWSSSVDDHSSCSSSVIGSKRQRTLKGVGAQQLRAMGFTNEEEVERVLRSHYGNFEKALLVLLASRTARQPSTRQKCAEPSKLQKKTLAPLVSSFVSSSSSSSCSSSSSRNVQPDQVERRNRKATSPTRKEAQGLTLLMSKGIWMVEK